MNFLELPDQGIINYHNQIKFETDGCLFSFSRGAEDKNKIRKDELCALRKKIGFVFQGFNLWQERSVLGNLTLAPRVVYKENRKSAENRAKTLCAQFGLELKIFSHINSLSGGEKQRVAIIRALMMRPDFMFLDEITSALDPILTAEVLQAIQKLKNQGLTMIVVTHHLEFASKLCDRIMFLSKGSIEQIDTPENLQKNPATEEIKKFLEVLKETR